MVKLFCFLLTLFVCFTSSAFAAPKKLSALFPGILIDTSKVYSRTAPQYAELMACQQSVDKSSCNSAGLARFYDFSKTKGVDDSYDYVNRCVGMRGFIRYAKDTLPNGSPTGNGLVITAPDEIECTGLLEDELIAAQLVVCYTRSSGAYCSFATACFEGSRLRGECPKDYVAETAFISRNSGAH